MQVNGGTVLAYSNDTPLNFSSAQVYYSYDLGCIGGTVRVVGGSLLADSFVTYDDKDNNGGKAYDDSGNEVFMTYISMKYKNLKEQGLLVTDIKVTVDGEEIVYKDGDKFGLPSYTDPDEMFYLWLPATTDGGEVSVELTLVDKDGNPVTTDPFYIKNVCSGAYLRQYVDFSDDLTKNINADTTLKGSLTKRYTGAAVFDETTVNSLKAAAVGIKLTNPKGESLSNTDLLTLTSHLLTGSGTTEDPYKTDGNVSNADLTKQVNAGKYRLTMTSTEFADRATFKESYWGHRANYDYAEITPADTQTSVEVTASDGTALTGVVGPDDKLTFSVTVKPHHGNAASEGVAKHDPEALTCEAPQGTVQLYITLPGGEKTKLGDPIDLSAAIESTDSDGNVTYKTDTSGYMYSTATLTKTLGDLSDYNRAQLAKGATITAEYTCSNGNYTTSSNTDELEPAAELTIAKTLTADDDSELPSGASSERFSISLSNLTMPDTSEGAAEGARTNVKSGTYAFRVVKVDENGNVQTNLLGDEVLAETDAKKPYRGTVQISTLNKGTSYESQVVYVGVTGDGDTVITDDDFTNTSGTFNIATDEKVIIEYLPASMTYSVSETLSLDQANSGYYLSDISYVDQGKDASGDATSIKNYGATGTLTADETTPVTVKNAYKTVTLTDTQTKNFTVTKKLDGGRTWGNDETFQFTLECRDDAPMPEAQDGVVELDTTNNIATLTVKGTSGGTTGTGSFGKITFTEAGTYTYVVNEVEPTSDDDSKDAKLAYSKEAYRVTVVVENATDTSGNYEGLEVTSVTQTKTRNEDGDLNLTLNVTKNISDWGEPNYAENPPTYANKNSFSYSLKDSSGTVIGTTATLTPLSNEYYAAVTNTTSVGSVKITKADTYTYTLTETGKVWEPVDTYNDEGEVVSTTYKQKEETTVYDIVLKVEEDANGVLQTTSVTKTVHPDKDGNVVPDDGTLSIYGTGAAADDGVVFTNTKVDDITVTEDTTIGIQAKKTLTGRSAGIQEDEFTFEVEGADYGSGDDATTASAAQGKLGTTTSFANGTATDTKDADDKVTSSTATTTNLLLGATFGYADVGKVYAYTVSEVIPSDAEKGADGVYHKNGVYYTNDTYTIYVRAFYNAENSLWLELYTSDPGTGKTATATPVASTLTDQTHVSATTLDFTNTYKVDTTLEVGDTQLSPLLFKSFTGRPDGWQDGDSFGFLISANSGTTVPFSSNDIKATKPASGSTAQLTGFGTATFDTPGTYSYTLRENIPGQATSATAAAAGHGSYSAVLAEYSSAKTDEAKAELLAFLQADDWTKDGITYDATWATLTITVTEHETNGVPDGTLEAKYTVTDEAGNSFSTFSNKYVVGQSYTDAATLQIQKTLVGADMTADQFSFKVEVPNATGDDATAAQTALATTLFGEEKDSTTVTGPAAAATMDDKKVSTATMDLATLVSGLSNLKFTASDSGKSYSFKVSEGKGSAGGYTYSDEVYTVTIEPTDDGDGTMTIKTTVTDADGDAIKGSPFTWTSGDASTITLPFENVYEATGTMGAKAISATKTLTGGKTLGKGDYSFTATPQKVGAGSGSSSSIFSISGTNEAGEDNGNGGYAATIDFNTVKFSTKTYAQLGNQSGVVSLPDSVAYGYATMATGTATDGTGGEYDGKTCYVFDLVVAESPENLPDGVSQVADKSSYNVKLVVADNGDGTLNIKTYADMGTGGNTIPGDTSYTFYNVNPQLEFENAYNVSAKFTDVIGMVVQKKLTGHSFTGDQFTVLAQAQATTGSTTLEEAAAKLGATYDESTDTASAVEITGDEDTTYADGDTATLSLPESITNMTFSTADAGKTYTFTLSEQIPDGAVEGDLSDTYVKDGYTYDSSAYKCVVSVSDDYKGKLTITVKGYKGSGRSPILTQTWKTGDGAADAATFTFYNSYSAEGVYGDDTNETALKGQKTVVDASGNVVTDSTGAVRSDLVQGFTFRIEADDTLDGGTENASYQLTDAAIKNGTVTLEHKSIDSQSSNGYFRVTSGTDGSFDFGTMTFTKPGTYSFKVVETVSKQGTGWTSSPEVKHLVFTVTDNNDGTLKVEGPVVTADYGTATADSNKVVKAKGAATEDLKFTNVYETTDGSYAVEIIKAVTGAAAETDFTFTLETTDEATKKAIDSGAITGISKGTNGKYQLTLTAKQSDFTTAGTSNTYCFSELGFTKTTPANTSYVFTVTEDTSNQPAYTTGSANKWTYDNHTFTLHIRVTDAGGRLVASKYTDDVPTAERVHTFTNSANASTTYGSQGGIRVEKTVVGGKEITAGMFGFTVSCVDESENDGLTKSKLDAATDATQTNKAASAAESTVSVRMLDTLLFDSSDSGKTFTYKVSETTAPSGSAWTNDSSAATVAITVHYDKSTSKIWTSSVVTKDGKTLGTYSSENGANAAVVPFTNTYTATGYIPSAASGSSIEATKTLSGRDLLTSDKDAFTFTVKTNDETQIATGAISDSAPLLSLLTDVVKSDGEAANISFSKIVFTTEEWSDTKAYYKTSGDTTTISLPMAAKAKNADNALVARHEYAKVTKADGTTTDSEVDFWVLDLTVSEIETGLPAKVKAVDGNKSFVVALTVIDDGSGTLSTKVTRNNVATTLDFQNTYTPTAATASVSVQKTVVNRSAAAGAFSYTLTATGDAAINGLGDGTISWTGVTSNTANDGTVYSQTISSVATSTSAVAKQAFGAMSFSRAGTYTFTVSEKSNVGGWSEDSTTRTVTVTVTDDSTTGKLSAAVSYDNASASTKTDKDASVAAFTNTYTSSYDYAAKGGMTVSKAVTGHDAAKGVFKYYVEADDEAAATLAGISQDTSLTTRTALRKEVAFSDKTTVGTAQTTAWSAIFDGYLKFDQSNAGRSYSYTVYEEIPDDATLTKDGTTYRFGDLDGSDTATQALKQSTGWTYKGYTYDSTIYHVTLTPTDDGKGSISVATSISTGKKGSTSPYYDSTTSTGGPSISFTNAYSASTTLGSYENLDLGIRKTLTGHAVDSNVGPFYFTITAQAGGSDDSATKVSEAAAKLGAASVSTNISTGAADTKLAVASDALKDMSFSQADAGKTYQFLIDETTSDGKDTTDGAGLTYDKATYTLTVTPVDNGDGTMGLTGSVAKTVDGATTTSTFSVGITGKTDEAYTDGLAFTNSYAASGALGTDAAGSISVAKTYVGSATAKKTFSFELSKLRYRASATSTAVTSGELFDAIPMPQYNGADQTKISIEATPNASAAATGYFNKISYTKPGIYTYQLKEVADDADDKTAYSTKVYTVTVNVADNHNGTLTASIAQVADEATTYNVSEPLAFLNVAPKKTATVVDAASGATTAQVGDVIEYKVYYYNNTSTSATVSITDSIPEGTDYILGSLRKVAGGLGTDGMPASSEYTATYDDGKVTGLKWHFNVAANTAPSESNYVSFKVRVTSAALSAGKVENSATIKVGDGKAITNTTSTTLATYFVPVTKTVALNGGVESADTTSFSFKLTNAKAADNKVLDGTYSYYVVDKGEAWNAAAPTQEAKELKIAAGTSEEFTLADGQTAYLKLSGGSTYTVVETSTLDSDNWSTSSTNESGTVSASSETAVFKNSYTPDAETLDGEDNIKISKTVEGRASLVNESYTFTLAKKSFNDGVSAEALAAMPLPDGETGNEVTTTVNMAGKAAGTAASGSFGDLSFTQTGTYVYTITEVNDGSKLGITYSKATYLLTVVVEADGSGLKVASSTLQQTKDDDGNDVSATAEAKNTGSFLVVFPGPSAEFTNTYTAPTSAKTVVASADANAEVLSGQMFGAGEEVVYKIDWTSNALDSKGAATAGTVTVTDTLPEGMSYASAVDGNGSSLKGTVTTDQTTGRQTVTFNLGLKEPAADNSPATGTIYLTAKVSSDNTNTSFSNEAAVESGNNKYTTNSVAVTAPVKVTTTKSAGIGDTIDYTVTFTNGTDESRTYTVTDEFSSYLSYNDDAKLADGSDGELGTVSCTNNTLTANVTLAAGKTATLQFSAKLVDMPTSGGSNAKATNSATVTDNTTKVEHKTNTVSTSIETGTLKVSKSITGENASSAPSTTSFPITISLSKDGTGTLSGSYSYQVYNSNGGKVIGDGKSGTISGSATVGITRNQYVVVEGLPEGAVATATEKDVPSGFSNVNASSTDLTATIVANKQATITVKNSYEATGSLTATTINATKVLTGGKSMNADDYTFTVTPKRFTSTTSGETSSESKSGGLFSISGKNAAASYDTSAKNATATINFDAVSFSTKTYSELGSSSNVVSLPDSVNYGYAEVMTEGTYEGQYHFVLTVAENTSSLPAGVTASGTTSYDVDLYVKDNESGDLYITVVYPNNASGLTFTNAYNRETTYGNVMRVVGNKTLSGRTILAGETFSYDVTAGTDEAAAKLAEGKTASDTLTYSSNVGAGKGYTVQSDALRNAFAAMSFSTADSGNTYTYTVKEQQPADAKDDVYNGITYDTTTYTIAISVSDDYAGTLTVKTLVSKAAGDVTTYLSSSTEEVSTWVAAAPNVSASDPTGYSYVWTTGGNTESAILEFKNVYAAGVTYGDDAAETALKGTKSVKSVNSEYTGTLDGAAFFIAGDEDDAATTGIGTSTYQAIEDGVVKFSGDRAQKSDANGAFSFGTVTFTKPGVYTFTVKETQGLGNAGWYDTKEVKTVVATVKDETEGAPNGKLTVSVAVTGAFDTTASEYNANLEAKDKATNDLAFTNTYTTTPSTSADEEPAKVQVLKNVTGADELPAAVSFTMTPSTEYSFKTGEKLESGSTDATTATAAAAGYILNADGTALGSSEAVAAYLTVTTTELGSKQYDFPVPLFTQEGYYTFVVKENESATADNWTYSTTTYLVQFRVYVQDVDGTATLKVARTTTGDFADRGGVTFTNRYGTSDSYNHMGGLEVVKTLSGTSMASGDFKYQLSAWEGITAETTADGVTQQTTAEAQTYLDEANSKLTSGENGYSYSKDHVATFQNAAATLDTSTHTATATMERLAGLTFVDSNVSGERNDANKTFSYKIVELGSDEGTATSEAGYGFDGAVWRIDITVKERSVDGKETLYTITKVTKYDSDGKQDGESKYYGDSTMVDEDAEGIKLSGKKAQVSFSNSYAASGTLEKDVEPKITATKTLTGRDLLNSDVANSDGSARLVFQLTNEKGDVRNTGHIATTSAADGVVAKAGKAAAIVWDKTIVYTTLSSSDAAFAAFKSSYSADDYTVISLPDCVKNGTARRTSNDEYVFEYTMTEVESGLAAGVTGVRHTFTGIDVTVKDDHTGKLTVSVKYPSTATTVNGTSTLEFTNNYTADATSDVYLYAQKTITGRSATTQSFGLTLAASTDDASTTGLGISTADAIKAGETYVTGEAGENQTRYTSGEIVKGTAQRVTFSPMQFKKAGTYHFTVSEVVPEGAVKNVYQGFTYDTHVCEITVKVTDDGSGKLTAKVSYDNKDAGESDAKVTTIAAFTNVYDASYDYAAEGGMSVSKTVSGSGAEPNTFKYYVEASSDAAAELAGITEAAPERSTKRVELSFDEEIDSGETLAAAWSEVFSGKLKFTPSNASGSYVYTVYEEIPSGATNASATTKTFGELGYDLASRVLKKTSGWTHNGWAYDSTIYRVTLTPTDDGNGTISVATKIEIVGLDGNTTIYDSATPVDGQAKTPGVTFSNSYAASTTVSDHKGLDFDVYKTMKGLDIYDAGGFTFAVSTLADSSEEGFATEAECAAKLASTSTVEEGTSGTHYALVTIRSGDEGEPVAAYSSVLSGMSFDQDDADKTFRFAVYEVASDGTALPADGNGWTYDRTSYQLSITVVNNGDGTLGLKGSVSDGKTTEFSQGVTDAEDVAYEGGFAFTNSYESGATYGDAMALGVQKTLDGREILASDSFSFDVVAGSDKAAAKLQTGKTAADTMNFSANAGDGSGSTVAVDSLAKAFAAMSFSADESGTTYTYTVTEHEPNGATAHAKDGVTYDTSSYTVSITPTDNRNGTMTITTVVKKDGVAVEGSPFSYTTGGSAEKGSVTLGFTNSYNANGVTAEGALAGKKTVKSTASAYTGTLAGATFCMDPADDATSAALKAGSISFNAGKRVATTDSTGAFDFGTVTVTKAGTYTFKAYETQGLGTAGWYNTQEYKLVTITAANAAGDPNGALTASVSIEGKQPGDGEQAEGYDASLEHTSDDLVFQNVYSTQTSRAADQAATVQVRKDVAGGQLNEGTVVHFSMTPVDGYSLETGEALEDGSEGETTLDAIAAGYVLNASGEALTTADAAKGYLTVATDSLGSKTYNFGALRFTREGYYTFKVVEDEGQDDVDEPSGWTYSSTIYYVQFHVFVKDVEGVAQLSVERVTEGSFADRNGVVFTNRYGTSDSYSHMGGLEVVKTLSGTSMDAGDFKFQVMAWDGIESTSTADGAEQQTTATTRAYLDAANEAMGEENGYSYDGEAHVATFQNPTATMNASTLTATATMERLAGLTFTKSNATGGTDDTGKTFSFKLVEMGSGEGKATTGAGYTFDGSVWRVDITVHDREVGGKDTLYTVTKVTKYEADGTTQVGDAVYYGDPSMVLTSDVPSGVTLAGTTAQVTFANSYAASGVLKAAGEPTINATKTMTGRALTNADVAQLSFSLTNSDGDVRNTGRIAATEDESGVVAEAGTAVKISWDKTIVYTTLSAKTDTEAYAAFAADCPSDKYTVISLPDCVAAGTAERTANDEYVFEYSMSESMGSLANAGVRGLRHEFDGIDVKVTDDHTGTLKVEVEYPTSATAAEDGTKTLAFQNAYTAAATESLALEAQVSISGTESTDAAFSVMLEPTEATKEAIEAGYISGETAQTASTTGPISSAEPAVVTFGALTFSKVGTYAFNVKQVVPEGAVDGVYENFTYDEHVSTVTVTVTDDGTGALKASAAYSNADGVTADDVALTTRAAFTNTYEEPTKVTIGAVQLVNRLTGRAQVAGDYKFTVTGAEGTGKTAEDAVAKLELVTTRDNYAIAAAADGEDSASVVVVGEGVTFTSADAGKTYAFYVEQTTYPTPVVAEDGFGYCNAKKRCVTIKIEDADGVLTASIYVDGTLASTVTSEDSASQSALQPVTLRFENSYDASTMAEGVAAVVRATKELVGRDQVEGEFNFGLVLQGSATDGSADVATASNEADGSVSFDALNYTLSGLKQLQEKGYAKFDAASDTYTVVYTAYEKTGSLPAGVSVVKGGFNVTVQVKDNGNGSLTATQVAGDAATFKNQYQATSGQVELLGSKKVASEFGTTVSPAGFEFTIAADSRNSSAPLPQKDGEACTTATSDASGNVDFGTITYTQADLEGALTYDAEEGTAMFLYTVTEQAYAGENAGITNDASSTRTVAVLVAEDAETATIEVTGVGTYDEATHTVDDAARTAFLFTNSYAPEPVDFSVTDAGAGITATKTLTGRDLEEGEFTFQLYDLDGSAVEGATGTNDAEGHVTFAALRYSEPGTHKYVMREVVPDEPAEGVTYSKAEWLVTVVVTDDGSGALKATATLSTPEGLAADAATFENTYSTTPTPGPDPDPDVPVDPDNPDTPDTPDAPDTPDTPDNPDTPDTPNTPDNPTEPTNPTTPSTPGTGTTLPKVGDPGAAAPALLATFGFATLALSRHRRRKR